MYELQISHIERWEMFMGDCISSFYKCQSAPEAPLYVCTLSKWVTLPAWNFQTVIASQFLP